MRTRRGCEHYRIIFHDVNSTMLCSALDMTGCYSVSVPSCLPGRRSGCAVGDISVPFRCTLSPEVQQAREDPIGENGVKNYRRRGDRMKIVYIGVGSASFGSGRCLASSMLTSLCK